MERDIELHLQHQMDAATHTIRGHLVPIDQVQNPQLIIQNYTAAIEGNFALWMAHAHGLARSKEGKFSTQENLEVEMNQDHQGMLRDFARSAGAEPFPEHVQYVEEEIKRIRQMISGTTAGLRGLTLMATLETTSVAFIPYLAELARKAKGKDFTYTNVHGEADIEHAQQFLWALGKEAKMGYPDPQTDIAQTIEQTLELLKKIFSQSPFKTF